MTEQGVCPSQDEMDAEETIGKLQRDKAALLAALEQCIPWLESMPLGTDQHLRDMAAKTLHDAQAAIKAASY